MPAQNDVTRLLSDMQKNKPGADEELLPLVYEQLRGLARYYMRSERSNHTLQTTALVHEAYLRLLGQDEMAWENRAHYFRVAARAMRRVLIDHARGKGRQKKGGGWQRESLEEATLFVDMPPSELLDLNDALTKLSEIDPPLAEVVELRFFGGLTVEDAAHVLEISPRKVKKDWRLAKAWLKRELSLED